MQLNPQEFILQCKQTLPKLDDRPAPNYVARLLASITPDIPFCISLVDRPEPKSSLLIYAAQPSLPPLVDGLRFGAPEKQTRDTQQAYELEISETTHGFLPPMSSDEPVTDQPYLSLYRIRYRLLRGGVSPHFIYVYYGQEKDPAQLVQTPENWLKHPIRKYPLPPFPSSQVVYPIKRPSQGQGAQPQQTQSQPSPPISRQQQLQTHPAASQQASRGPPTMPDQRRGPAAPQLILRNRQQAAQRAHQTEVDAGPPMQRGISAGDSLDQLSGPEVIMQQYRLEHELFGEVFDARSTKQISQAGEGRVSKDELEKKLAGVQEEIDTLEAKAVAA